MIGWCVSGVKLRRMTHSSVKMESHLPAVIDDMCRQLHVSPVSPDCDYRELVSTQCVHDRAREVLEEATNEIQPESNRYRELHRCWMGICSSYSSHDLYDAIQQKIDYDVLKPGDLSTIPETTLLCVIDNIPGIVKEGYTDMFGQALYRDMGECYLALYIHVHLSDVDSSLTRTCQDKAVHYYTLGREMRHPDGWSDRGLGGYVRLATLYYLSGQWSQLKATLKELEPLLEESKESVEDINGQSLTVLSFKMHLSLYTWKTDTDMYSLISTWDYIHVYLHPVPLSYYILARFALRQEDREGATRALHNIEGCVDEIMSIDVDKPTRCLIDILKKTI